MQKSSTMIWMWYQVVKRPIWPKSLPSLCEKDWSILIIREKIQFGQKSPLGLMGRVATKNLVGKTILIRRIRSLVSTQCTVDLSRFLYYSDFTWNQFCRFYKCKNCRFANLGAVNFVHLVNYSLTKSPEIIKNQNSEPLNMLEWQILHF